MNDGRYSVSQTVGGQNLPLLDLTNKPDDVHRFVEAQEAMYDFVAAFVAKAMSEKNLGIKVSSLLKAHKIGYGFIDSNAGQIRNLPVALTNSAHKPPRHEDVLILLEELCDFANDNFRNLSRCYLAAYFLWRLLWIHPFTEGNGSIARLFSYAIIQIDFGSMLPGAKTLPVLLSENRLEYYEALVDADKHYLQSKVNIDKLERLICRLLELQLLTT